MVKVILSSTMKKERKIDMTGIKNSYYFPHDCNARTDEKVLKLRAKFGWEGYGIFWAIVETLSETSDGYFELDEEAIGGLSLSIGVAIDKLKEILDYLIKIKLLSTNNSQFFNRRILEHIELRKSFVVAGRKGAISRWGDRGANGGVNAKERKGKEIKQVEIKKEKLAKQFGFEKPSM